MNRLKIFCTGVISASIGLSSVAVADPVVAAPVELAQYHGSPSSPSQRPGHSYGRPQQDYPTSSARPSSRPHQPSASRPSRDRPGYYKGYHGSNHRRPGYRRHSDGWWYPLAAFTAGAIIGGSTMTPRPSAPSRPSTHHRLPKMHYKWCYSQYRSYRASDNSFQPNYGPRRACVSPYI